MDPIFWFILLVVLFVAITSSFITQKSVQSSTYQNLVRSPYQPPNYVFGLVWTLIYILLIAGVYLGYTSIGSVDTSNSLERRWLIILFLINIGLNFLWTILFFGFFNYLGALVVAVLLLISTIVLAWYLYKIRPPLALFLVPYILWLFVAIYLNWYIVQNN